MEDFKLTTLQHLDSGEIEQEHREYIGYSQAGQSCARKIYYDFRWASLRKISQRTKRIFDLGDILEIYIIRKLEEKGIFVFSQQKEIVGQYGHSKGHIDGVAIGIPNRHGKHLLEIKTMNDSRFKKAVKIGIKKSDPVYYSQVIAYMEKLNLQCCMFVIYNKNNSALDIQYINRDKDEFELIENKLFDILTAMFPPERIGNRTWFECKGCSQFGICHDDEPVSRNCRTCELGTIENNGIWTCDSKKVLSYDDQLKGCREWQMMEGLQPIEVQFKG